MKSDTDCTNEIYIKPQKRPTLKNKTDVCYKGVTWSMNLLELNDYGPKKRKVTEIFWYYWIYSQNMDGQNH